MTLEAETTAVNRSLRPVWTVVGVVLLVAIAFFAGHRSGVDSRSPSGIDRIRDTSPVLASVNGQTLTVDEFVRKLGRYSGSSESAAQLKQALVDDWVDFQVLLAQAREQGYETDPEIVAAHERMLVNKFREDELRERSGLNPVSRDAIEDYYRANADEFRTPTMARAAIIEILIPDGASDAVRSELLQKAAEAREAALQDNDITTFGAIAGKYSDHRQSRYTGGDLGWLNESGVDYKIDSKVKTTIFAMAEPGSVSDVVAGESAFYIVKLVEKRPAATRALADVQDQIKRRLTAKNRRLLVERFMSDVRSDHSIDVDEDLLNDIDLGKRTAANEVPALPIAIQ